MIQTVEKFGWDGTEWGVQLKFRTLEKIELRDEGKVRAIAPKWGHDQ